MGMLTKKPNHMTVALGEVGQQEVAGAGSNPRIVEYHQATKLRATDDDVPWCAAFANWVLAEAKMPNTESAAALSFLKWGRAVKSPAYGDVVVFDYGNGRGHVGFFVDAKDGKVGVLGGNQNNAVNITWFTTSNYNISYRRVKTGWDSTTVTAAATVLAVQAGNSLTTFHEAVLGASTKATEVVTTAAGVSQTDIANQMGGVSNFVLAFVPPEYQPVAQGIVTLLGVAWIIRERLKKIKEGV